MKTGKFRKRPRQDSLDVPGRIDIGRLDELLRKPGIQEEKEGKTDTHRLLEHAELYSRDRDAFDRLGLTHQDIANGLAREVSELYKRLAADPGNEQLQELITQMEIRLGYVDRPSPRDPGGSERSRR